MPVWSFEGLLQPPAKPFFRGLVPKCPEMPLFAYFWVPMSAPDSPMSLESGEPSPRRKYLLPLGGLPSISIIFLLSRGQC